MSGRSVCIVGMHYVPETTGNAPYTTAMARHLASLGVNVHVVTGVPHYPEWAVRPPYDRGMRWEELDLGVRLSRRRHVVPRRQGVAGRAMLEASFLTTATSAALRSDAQAFIAVTPTVSAVAMAAMATAIRRRPLGIVVQDLTGNAASESGTTGSRAGDMIAKGEYGLLRRADLVGVITPRFGEILIDHGVARSRVVSLPNFTHIQASTLGRRPARKELGWPENSFLVLHTGNMGRKQGLESVIEAARLAAARTSKVEFVFVGEGNQRADLEMRARGLSNVRFIDPLDAERYPLALAAADVLLVNERATVKEMSLPSKLTSYFAAGRPVVAAVVPGGITAEVAHRSGACLIVAAGDPGALVSALVQIEADAALAEGLAKAAAAFAASELGAEAALGRYAEFTQRLLNLGQARSR